MADVNRGPGVVGRYLPLFVSLSLSHSTWVRYPKRKLANLYLRRIFPAIRSSFKPQKLCFEPFTRWAYPIRSTIYRVKGRPMYSIKIVEWMGQRPVRSSYRRIRIWVRYPNYPRNFTELSNPAICLQLPVGSHIRDQKIQIAKLSMIII